MGKTHARFWQYRTDTFERLEVGALSAMIEV
jgi:hypothetical protein